MQCGGAGQHATVERWTTGRRHARRPPSRDATAESSACAGRAVKLPTGEDLCYLLSAADFTAAGVGGAGPVTTNEYDTEFYCVWAGKSAATGGIELDAFIVDDPTGRDESFGGVDPGFTPEDVTAKVPGAEKAHIGTTSSGGPNFAEIGVQSGNLIFGLAIPPAGDWHGQLESLAGLVLSRAAAVTAGQASLPAQAKLPDDLCSWVTAADLAPLASDTLNSKGAPDISGEVFFEGTQGTYFGKQVTCRYGFGADPNSWSGGLIMDVAHTPNELTLARKVYDEQVTYYGGLATGGDNTAYTVTPLSGMGDAAQKVKSFQSDTGALISWLVIAVKGPVIVHLSLQTGADHDVAGSDTALTALAKKVLEQAATTVGSQ